MSHFIKWLILPSMIGSIIYLIGVFNGTPDNKTALVVCVGMSFWYIFFVHFWRRNQATHAVKWGTLSIGPTLEPTRPGFKGTCRINPVTGRIDRYYPWSERVFKVLFSYTCLTLSVLCLSVIIGCLFFLRHVFHKHGGRVWFMVINAVVVEILNNIFTYIAKKLTIAENHRSYSEHANH